MRHAQAAAVKAMLSDGGEIALVDVREHGQYGEGHPFFAVNMPYRRLEMMAPRLMPRRAVRCVVLDNGDGVAEKAACRLSALGYTDITVMEGGSPGWEAAGFTLFKGINVPSKAFGELVEHDMQTPSISAAELKAAQEAGDDLMLLDGRTPEEFRRMALPGARSCPNAELGYRLPALGTGRETRIVINCAGRTRSIIGAQTLRNLGVAHEVVALRNGTQGWQLAGLDLARGTSPGTLPELSPAERAASRDAARHLISTARIPLIEPGAVDGWHADPSRTSYLFDVRTAEEFAAAHVPGAVHAPGGQLVQATDHWVAVRGARIALSDDTGLRAATTALWLRGMGYDAAVLSRDASREKASTPVAAPAARLAEVACTEIAARLDAGAALIDLSPSMSFRRAHISGARWAIRPRLERLDFSGASEILLVARERGIAELAALDLAERYSGPISFVPGTEEHWQGAGLRLATSPDDPPDNECIDFLFFVHDRHHGNLAAARAYLDWETGLLDELDAQERGSLNTARSLPGSTKAGLSSPSKESVKCSD